MIKNLKTISILDALLDKSYILDTCFLIYEIEKGNTRKLENFCKENACYLNSFNVEELEKVERRIPNIKHAVESFLKKKLIKIIKLDIHIGDVNTEKLFAEDTDKELLKKIADPSDAVMVAAGIQTKSDILTRDKHHVFTIEVEKEISKFGIKILNTFPN